MDGRWVRGEWVSGAGGPFPEFWLRECRDSGSEETAVAAVARDWVWFLRHFTSHFGWRGVTCANWANQRWQLAAPASAKTPSSVAPRSSEEAPAATPPFPRCMRNYSRGRTMGWIVTRTVDVSISQHPGFSTCNCTSSIQKLKQRRGPIWLHATSWHTSKVQKEGKAVLYTLQEKDTFLIGWSQKTVAC